MAEEKKKGVKKSKAKKEIGLCAGCKKEFDFTNGQVKECDECKEPVEPVGEVLK